MSEAYSCAFDVGTLLHNLLFSYQKSTKQLLGTSYDVFYHPTIDLLLKIEERSKLKLISADTLEEALTNYATFLTRAQVLKNFEVKNVDKSKLNVATEGCIWANHIHSELSPKDVMCPWALIAMAIVQKFTGLRLKETESNYTDNGANTILEPL